jgi:dinuclear metal center YbgI/SA1388 family protein
MAKLEQVLQFLTDTLETPDFPDYPNALNGLQVSGPEEVSRVATAVDASEVTINAAVTGGFQLLVVHHGLFWDGVGPLTGPRFRKVAALVRGGVGLYSVHLPLDAHPEVGNCAILARSVGVSPAGRFGMYKEVPVGWWGVAEVPRGDLQEKVGLAVGGEARLVPGGPEVTGRVGVVTGGGSGFLADAASFGLDTLITGEAPHHAYHEAMEMGINLILGGHYATETFGVKAIGDRLVEEFGVFAEFLEYPTGF